MESEGEHLTVARSRPHRLGAAVSSPLAGASERTLRVLLYAVVAMLAVPLFVRVGGPSLIGLPDSASVSSGGTNIPVGAVLAVITASWLAVRRRQEHTNEPALLLDRAVLLFAAVAFAVLVIGLVTRPGPYNVLYFGQTVLPLAAYYVVSRLARTDAAAYGAVVSLMAGAAVSGGLMLLQALVSRGLGSMLSSQLENHVGPLNIYQSNDYVPFVFAIVFLVVLHKRTVTERLGPIPMLVLFGLGVVVLASYARGPVFVLIFGLAALVVQTWRGHRQQTFRALAVGTAALGVAVVLGFPSTERVTALINPIVGVARGSGLPLPTVEPKTTPATGQPQATPTGGSEPARSPVPQSTPNIKEDPLAVDQPSNDTRTIALRVSADYVLRHPVYGGGFAPTPPEELSPILTDSPPNKIFAAHNQYLDLGLRGGVPLLLSYLAVMIVAALSGLRIVRSSPTIVAGAIAGAVLTGLAASLLVGNLYQNNFTQPYPAFVLWGLIGLVAGLDARRHSVA